MPDEAVCLLGAAAIPCGKWQTPPDAAEQVLEHEVLAKLVVEAVADAGVSREDVSSLVFALPRPYTQQKYFATFMASYLRLPCTGRVAEIMGNGMTAGLAFEAACDDIRLGRARVALAQFRKPVTLGDVMAQPMIVEPLGLYEVPPRSDGAACLVLCREDVARASGRPYARIRGRGFHHEGAHQISEVPNDMIAFGSVTRAGREAFAEAGVTPNDIDFAELYAPCTIVEVLVSEALGFCPRGRGAAACRDGETRLGGRIPLSTSGSLLSRGHPAYVTPFYSFLEALDQLRDRAGARQVSDARLGVTTAELGNYNAALVHVLEAVR